MNNQLISVQKNGIFVYSNQIDVHKVTEQKADIWVKDETF
jgi:hypothetical protein